MTFIREIRYGIRALAESPGLTIVALLTLALGIGANTAIFSVVNGWLLRPLPVAEPDQIVVLARYPGEPRFSYPDLVDFRNQADTFSDIFTADFSAAGLSADGIATEFAYSAVTGNYFSALGVKPALGRLFRPGEGESQGDEPLVVLGYSYWQKRFAGSSGVVGKQALINGRPATIVGVAAKQFHGTLFAFEMDGYFTLNATSSGEATSEFWSNRGERRLSLLGRLRPGVSLQQAQSSVDVIARRLAAQYPATDKSFAIKLIAERFARPAPFVTSFVPVIASLFLALPALVLLLACLNVANILLARATMRQREIAIRAALGATRARLIRMMLTESVLLALFGGIAGVILAKATIAACGSAFRAALKSSSNYSFSVDCSFDWRVLAYGATAVVATGIIAGLWPAFRASRADANLALHEGGRSSAGKARLRIRSAMVLAQVAGSLLLLTIAGLFVRSLSRAEHLDLGFNASHVLNVMLDPHQIGYDEIRTRTFYRELEQRLRLLPGVQAVSIASTVPLSVPSRTKSIFVEGHPLAKNQAPPVIAFNSTDPYYLETMQIPLLRGRSFSDSDGETAPPVVIVNQTMARRLWPNEDPLGRRISLKDASGVPLQVVGVARDGQSMWMLTPDPQSYFYLPLAQSYTPFCSLQIRSSVPPESLMPAVQDEIHRLAPDLPVFDIRTMAQFVHGLAGLFLFRLAASLSGLAGGLGLVLAAVGVYGIVSHSVTQRTNEIGIRMALGAQPRDILKLVVVRRGLGLVMAGVIIGLVLAWLVTRPMKALLIGITSSDPLTYGAVTLLLSAIGLMSCWVPARRATKVDPMVALRCE